MYDYLRISPKYFRQRTIIYQCTLRYSMKYTKKKNQNSFFPLSMDGILSEYTNFV